MRGRHAEDVYNICGIPTWLVDSLLVWRRSFLDYWIPPDSWGLFVIDAMCFPVVFAHAAAIKGGSLVDLGRCTHPAVQCLEEGM